MYQRSGWLGQRHDLALPFGRDVRVRLLASGVFGLLPKHGGLE